MPWVTGHSRGQGKKRRETEYSHRIEEVGTPLTALEGLKDGRERGGGQGYWWRTTKHTL